MASKLQHSASIGVLAFLAAVATAGSGSAQTADPGSPTLAADQSTQVDEIIVTGIRRSIQDALDTKRESVNVVDAISAEDIGKLPDQNVVESLARVPGVQIVRGEGDGAGFTVRGISLNTILLNGRPFTPATADSTSKLDTISPDIFSSLQVIKSPSADLVEGALGGTINLITKRPLDLDPRLFSLRAQADYGDQAEDFGYRASVLASGRFFDDTIGVLANFAYQDKSNRQDVFDTVGWTRTNGIDGNGDGVNDANLFRPLRLSSNINPRDTTRTTSNLAIQWRPNDTFSLLVEAAHNKFELERFSQRYQILLTDNDVGARADADGTVVSSRINGITLRPLIYDELEEYENSVLGANATWNLGRLTVTADLAYSTGRSPQGFSGSSSSSFVPLFVPRAGRNVDVNYNFANGSDVPSFNLLTNFDVNDPTQYQFSILVDGYSTIDNEAKSGRLDANYDLGWGALASIDVGVRLEDRSLFTERFNQNVPPAGLLAVADRNRDGIITYDEVPGVHRTGNIQNPVFNGLSGDFIRVFPGGGLDIDEVRRNLGVSNPPLEPVQTKDVQQSTTAAYAKLNLIGDFFGFPYRGHAGVRVVDTERTSAGFVLQPNGSYAPVSFSRSYTEWLPSAAVAVDLTDTLILRLAAARVSASPPLNDLSAGISFTITNNTGSGGNPLLDPYRTDQFDAGLEWYFGPSSILAGTVFYKKVSSFTQTNITNENIPGFVDVNGNGTIFRISRPVNGSDGSVSGLELNYQQAFDFLPAPFDGFGVQLNYTYADSETPTVDELTQQTLPLPQLSRDSASAIAYYENDTFSARLAYTYRSGYLLQVQTAAAGGSRFVESQDSLDASVSYTLTPSLKLVGDLVNILKNPEVRYDGVSTRISQIFRDDRRVTFGFIWTL